MAEASKPCSIDGCNGDAHYRSRGVAGLCSKHHRRKRAHGDPLAGKTSPGELLRFINEVALHHTGDDCLPWPFARATSGYGLISVDGRNTNAARHVCGLTQGPPPTPKHEALHSCGNGHLGCVSPEHLRWGLHVENMQDMIDHGRSTRGTSHPSAILTEDDVRAIRALRGAATQRSIASRFGVHVVTVNDILTGKTWGWLQ